MPKARNNSPGSFWPEDPDSLVADILREAVDRWEGNLPATLAEFRGVVASIAIEAMEEVGTAAAGQEAVTRKERETIARLVSEFIEAKNPRLVAQCYDFVFQLGLQLGISQVDIAEQHGVGKAAVSQRCRAIVENFGLAPARGMKSPRAVRVYRQRELKKHQARREEHRPWALAGAFAAGFTGHA